MALINAEEYNEMVFIVFILGNLMVSILYYLLYPQTLDIRWSMFLGLMVQSIFCIYLYLLPEQRSQAIQGMSIGSFFMGIACMSCVIYGAKQLDMIGQYVCPDASKEQINNMSSGVFNSCMILTEMLGPILCGFLYDSYGFRQMFFYIGVVGFILCLVYITLGRAYQLFIKDDGYQVI